MFGVAVVNATTISEFLFPSDEGKATGNEKINIPSSVFVSESGKEKRLDHLYSPSYC